MAQDLNQVVLSLSQGESEQVSSEPSPSTIDSTAAPTVDAATLRVFKEEASQPTEQQEATKTKPIKHRQETTRSFLAIGIAIGLAIALTSMLWLDHINRNKLYNLIEQSIEQGNEGFEPGELLNLKKEQDQASIALMNLIITAGFSTFGTALGFYFSTRSDN